VRTPPRSPHLQALHVAQQCVELQARPRTISLVSGLDQREVERNLPPGYGRAGRCPSSPEWYHSANLVQKVEASIFASHYRRIRDSGFTNQESLIDGYRRYRSIVGADPCISFDRAFNLVCHLDAVWRVRERAFDLKHCRHCGSRYLVPVGDTSYVDECVFCKFVQRYPVDPRLQTRFPARPLPDVSGVKQSLRVLAYLDPP
jgi:hypothetical protein